MLDEQRGILVALARLDNKAVDIIAQSEGAYPRPEGHLALVVGPVEVYLPLEGLVEAGTERARLEKDLAKVQAQIDRLEELLGGSFAGKAPAAVVQKERNKLAGYQETAARLRAQLDGLG